MKYFLSIDLGLSFSRHTIGYYEENKLKTTEIYRFENKYLKQEGHLTWDLDYLFIEVIRGIRKAVLEFGKIESLSITSWGYDYVLMNNERPILPCYAFKDERTKKVCNSVFEKTSKEFLYERTGVQIKDFNTLFQLYDDLEKGRLNEATDFLMIPEYLIYKLTGKKIKEYTNATTTGLVNLESKQFDNKIISKLHLPKKLFPDLYQPETIVGDLTSEVIKVVGINIITILGATQDTASAVEAIEVVDAPYIWMESKALLGVKSNNSNKSLDSMNSGWSNEGGIGCFHYQKNLMGLEIVQILQKEIKVIYEKMVSLAKTSSYQEIFDVNDYVFSDTTKIKEAIINWYQEHEKIIPNSDASLVNGIFHSLAYSFKTAIKELEKNIEKSFDRIIIVGNGAKNQYLNDLISSYCNKKVEAYPIEANTMGNLMVQIKIMDKYEPKDNKKKSKLFFKK